MAIIPNLNTVIGSTSVNIDGMLEKIWLGIIRNTVRYYSRRNIYRIKQNIIKKISMKKHEKLDITNGFGMEEEFPLLLSRRIKPEGKGEDMQKMEEKPAGAGKNRLVFFVGIDETERGSIVEMVAKNYRDSAPGFKLIKIESMPNMDDINMAKMSEKKKMFLQKIEKSIQISGGRNVVLSGQLVHRIKDGYLPLLSEEFIEKIKPDFFVFFYVDTDSLKTLGGKLNISDVKRRQDMNWECMKSYCLRMGVPMKMVKVTHGDIKSVIASTYQILKSAFE